MERHTSRTFDREIDRLSAHINVMGKLCEWQLAKAVKAFSVNDKRLADEVIKADEKLNQRQHTAEADVIQVLAKRQPVATDLRYIISIMKIASEFERIGDYASNISKRVILLDTNPFPIATGFVDDMARIGRNMINSALEAFETLDEAKAIEVWHQDDQIDSKFVRFMNSLKREMGEDTALMEAYTSFIFVGRCCERIGDHITNIAENIYFIKTGHTYLSDSLGD